MNVYDNTQYGLEHTSYSSTDSAGAPLDKKLDALFSQKIDGFFIELGANDGVTQSNSAFFEYHRGWKGVLIEPSSSQYDRCTLNRPNSHCFNAACVSESYTGDTVTGDFDGSLMASVDGKRCNSNLHISVPAKTLTSILDSVSPPIQSIDLLSLDTEGYELSVLQGLDLTKYRPHYMIIEVYSHDYDALVSFLMNNKYALVSNFSNYSRVTNPGWDGSHNDYLFKDELSA